MRPTVSVQPGCRSSSQSLSIPRWPHWAVDMVSDKNDLVWLLKHTIVGKKKYNFELTMISKSEINYSDEILLNHTEHG